MLHEIQLHIGRVAINHKTITATIMIVQPLTFAKWTPKNGQRKAEGQQVRNENTSSQV